ncbi:MAG TPA: hypothetical protein VFU07_05185 [Candidatus Lumbricidophila sp.]|nr:hypothetical protein [Candidatus Lumbricidophila sp.]
MSEFLSVNSVFGPAREYQDPDLRWFAVVVAVACVLLSALVIISVILGLNLFADVFTHAAKTLHSCVESPLSILGLTEGVCS